MNETTQLILEEMAAGRIPDTIPDTAESAETLRQLAQYFTAIQQFTLGLSKGDLSQSLQGVSGPVAGGLKSLQSALRHLTWQTKQIAAGDFSQSVDFMGDFSMAFNTMVEDLASRKVAEEGVVRERNFSDDIINSLPGIFYMFDDKGNLVRWNKKYEEVTGYSPEELQGKHVLDFFPEEQQHLIASRVQSVFAEGESFAESPLQIKNGRQIPYYFTGRMATLDGQEYLLGLGTDITERKRAEEERAAMALRQEGVNLLQRSLLKPAPLEAKLAGITDGIVQYFGADFCRIWLIRPGDRCDQECMHAKVLEGPHVCRQRDRCLHLLASSGRYTHKNGRVHCRVPFGCYKIGRIASGEAHKFLTNEVENDPRIHDHEWAHNLGLVSFAGYQLRVPEGEAIGVLALFSKRPLRPPEDAMLDGLSSAVALAVQQAAAENALHENTLFLNTLLNALPVPVFYKDRQCRYLGANKAYEKFICKTCDQLLGKSVFDIAPPELAEVYHAKDLELLRDRGMQVYESQVKDMHGVMHDVVFHKATFMDSGGRTLGLIGAILDITERKRVEKALSDSRQQLMDIFDFLPDATFVLDNDKKVIAWNRAIEEMTGISKAEMLGQGDYAHSVPFYGVRRPHLLDLLDIDDKELEAKYKYVQRKGNRLHVEASTPALYGGKGAWIWAFGAPLYNAKGERIGAIEAVRDITAQKEAQLALKESRQQLMDIIEFLPDATLIIDRKGTIMAWNRAMEVLTGIKAQEMLGKGDYEYAIPFYGERRLILIDFALRPDPEREKFYTPFRRNGDTLVGETYVPSLRSSKAYLSTTASVLRDSKGEIVAAIECIRDDTKRKEMEDALRASQDQLALAMELSRLVKWESDIATGMFTFNDQFYALYGTNAEREGGYVMPSAMYIREFVHPDDALLVAEVIGDALASTDLRNPVQLEHRIVRRNGEVRDLAVKFKALRDNNGNIIKLYGANQDITEHKRLEKMLNQQAHTDQMTGANNRGYFLELLDVEIERARRYGRSLCILMLDLDHFKSVNDTRGHAAGDEAIRTVIRVLQSSGLRQSDFLGRIGGEEFAVALPETDLQDAADAAERVRSLLAATPVSYASETFSITVSIGVCRYRDGDSQETLLQRADQAMYQAKQTGRNRVCLLS